MPGEANLQSRMTFCPPPRERCGKCAAGVEDKQIARSEEIADAVKARMRGFSCLPIDDHQPHSISCNSPALRWLTGRALFREFKFKWVRHISYEISHI